MRVDVGVDANMSVGNVEQGKIAGKYVLEVPE